MWFGEGGGGGEVGLGGEGVIGYRRLVLVGFFFFSEG